MILKYKDKHCIVEELEKNDIKLRYSDESEEADKVIEADKKGLVLVRIICDRNLPKFLYSDCILDKVYSNYTTVSYPDKRGVFNEKSVLLVAIKLNKEPILSSAK